jgi:outer membrane protein assembly factor BamB
MKKRIKYISLLVLSIVLLSLFFTGCMGGQSPQGWSGCNSNDTNIYYGSMDSRVMCINPDSRSRGLSFPDKELGEWYALIRGPATGGGMCGPLFGCAPSGASVVAIYSTPVISGELVYVGTYLGKVRAYNAISGSERWIYPRDVNDSMGAIVGNIILVDDTLYITSANGYIYALEKEYGDKIWEFNTGSRIWTTPAYSDGMVYAGNYSGKLVAVSSDKGNEIWSIDLPTSSCSSPVVYKDKIIIGAFDHKLYAISKVDGSIEWEFAADNWFWTDVITQGNTIYACSMDHNVYAINGDNGELKWKFDTGASVSARPVLVDDLLVAVNQDGQLYILNAANGTSKQVLELGHKVIAPLYEIDNVVYAHGTDDYVYAVDLNKGELLWNFKSEIQ